MPIQTIPPGDDVKEVIRAAFDVDLELSGDWGYTRERAMVVKRTDVPLQQLEHTLASMRAYIEMHLTMPEEERYGAINVNEKTRECISENNKIYDKITYEISGMLERDYEALIEEYKAGYESPGFDIEAHFQKRREKSVVLERDFWFDITHVNKSQ